jgi:hypothetical protein
MKRFIVSPDVPFKKIDDLFLQAKNNSANTVIITPSKADLKSDKKLSSKTALILEKAAHYKFDVEIGGWILSDLVPRKYFFLHKEIFRMESGKRKRKIHFCTTNPDTINLIKKEAGKLFNRFPEVSFFHLWFDKNKNDTWCNCPSCRAFSFAELNLIAVNAAADVLSVINPGAMISYIEIIDEDKTVQPRENMFAIDVDSIISNE